MQMTGQRLLPVPRQQAWDALNDPEMLKACIPGCDSIVQTDPNTFEVLMAARIGPVSARFKGRLTQSDVVEPESYTLAFDGQGGVAGFGKGTAGVRLTPVDGGTMLDYEANAQVGGKIAQIGSRLVDAAAAKIADEFFKTFETKLTETAAADAASLAQASADPHSAAASTVTGHADTHHDHSHGADAHHAGHQPAAPSAGSDTRGWQIGFIVLIAAAALIAYLVR
jgi:carbon monoxide dehydrogenase subunit G